MSTPGGLVDKQELIDAQLDTAHLGRVVNSKDASGAPISTSTNRTGGVNKTLDALEAEYLEAIRAAGGVSVGTWTAGVTTFNAYNEYAVYNGIPYKPRTSATLPYVAQGADPTVAPDDANVQPYQEISEAQVIALVEETVPGIVSGTNIIPNSDFATPGSVSNPPDAAPRSYNAGDELFKGFKAVISLSGVTYVDGKINGTGQLYVDIYKTEKQKLSTAEYVASIASSDGVPIESGASFLDSGDYWRVTFDMNDTFSVKLEQGDRATSHEVPKLDVTLTDEINKLDRVNRSRSLMGINVNKPLNTWGMRAPINNLGDSISHGAFAGELYYNGWTRILARMLSGDFGGLSYQGFVPMLTLGSGPTSSRDIHSITFSGTWNGQDSASTVNGAAAYNGLSFQSTNSGDYVQTTIPSFQNKARIWYLQQPGGGELTVSDNTGTLSVINTDGALSVQSALIATVDNGQGSCFIRGTKTDATGNPVDICGFGYFDDVETPTLHNFSQSGRRLHYVNDQTISDLSENASIFMLSLGHNDQGDVDADPQGAYATQFTAKIDKIIEQCNLNNTLLVVNDFCWTAADTSFARQELQRASKEANGVYIPFPNLIKPDGSIPDSNYIVNTIDMWEDGSHPNADGNKWIAETIAKYLGLSCSSKKMAVATNDYWMPFAIPAGTKNRFTNPANVSAYRINGEELNYRYAVQKSAGGSFPVGAHNLQVGWRVDPPFTPVGSGLALPGVVRVDTNILTSSVSAGQTGSFNLTVTDGTWVNGQDGIAKLPIFLK